MKAVVALVCVLVPASVAAQKFGSEYDEFFKCQEEKATEAAALPDDAEVLGRIVTQMCPIESQKVETMVNKLLPVGRAKPTMAEFLANQAKTNAARIVQERIARLKKKSD